MNNRTILLLGFAFLVMGLFVDPAFCVTDANIKSAYTEVSKRGVDLTNVILAISGLAAVGFAMFQEYGWAKGFGVGTALFAGYKHFVGDGSACTLDMAQQLLSQDFTAIHQVIQCLC